MGLMVEGQKQSYGSNGCAEGAVGLISTASG